jgi:hypothetical protein
MRRRQNSFAVGTIVKERPLQGRVLICNDLRGDQAPLFHGATTDSEVYVAFFASGNHLSKFGAMIVFRIATATVEV